MGAGDSPAQAGQPEKKIKKKLDIFNSVIVNYISRWHGAAIEVQYQPSKGDVKP